MNILTFEIPQGDQRYVDVDYNVSAGNLSTTVSSAAWSLEEGSTVSVSGESVSSNVARALITADANKTGCTLVKIKATMADTQTVSEYVKINVIDPTC